MKSLKFIAIPSIALAGAATVNDDTYFLLNGILRGARSIWTGIKIIASYKIVNISYSNFIIRTE